MSRQSWASWCLLLPPLPSPYYITRCWVWHTLMVRSGSSSKANRIAQQVPTDMINLRLHLSEDNMIRTKTLGRINLLPHPTPSPPTWHRKAKLLQVGTATYRCNCKIWSPWHLLSPFRKNPSARFLAFVQDNSTPDTLLQLLQPLQLPQLLQLLPLRQLLHFTTPTPCLLLLMWLRVVGDLLTLPLSLLDSTLTIQQVSMRLQNTALSASGKL